MRYLFSFILVTFFLPKLTFSQDFTLKGTVHDNTGAFAIGAPVVLLNPDSSLVKGSITDLDGNFVISSVAAGNYILKITYLGFATNFRTLQVADSINLGVITLKTSAKTLKEVEVVTKAPIATQSGDTSSFSSKAYKTNKDASAEDLVTKMPGVTVTDGKVQAQGEDVKQVLVDGQTFFGDDAASVLKNLPAEVIEKVQVFDRKSDQAQFTGIDDGNTSKTINIVTKAQFRNGIFGKAYAGYGYEDKYKAGLNFNRFKDKRRITVLLMSNNINEQNFSSEDLLGVTAGSTSNSGRGGSGQRGGNRGGRSGGMSDNPADNFLVNIRNGITTTNAAGLNYSDKWNNNTTVSASYFFNWTDNSAVSSLLRQYIVGSNKGLNYSENNLGESNNYNHRFSSRIETKIDSSNSLILQPKFSIQMNDGSSSFLGTNTNNTLTISNSSNSFGSALTGMNFSLPVLYRHSFAKRGRTISLDLNPSYNMSEGSNQLKTYNTYYTDSLFTDTVDQRSQLDKSGYSALGNLVYTEPLSKSSSLSFNYTGNYTASESAKNTYVRSGAGDNYSLRDSSLSNIFQNQYTSNAGGFSYRYNKEKINLSVSASYQQAFLFKQQEFPSMYSSGRVFESILPGVWFQYKFTPKKNLRVNYRANNQAPSIDQLQDVLNNNNALQLSIGNPELRQTFQNNLNLRYSAVNTDKATSLFALLGGTYTDDYISNSTIVADNDTVVYNNIFLAKGSQITRPVNLSNYYNLRTFFNYSFSIKKLRSTLNINASANYNNVPALINNKTNYSNTTNTSLGLVLSSNVSENLDFTLSSTPSYNYVSNTLQSDLNSTYYNQSSRAKVTWSPWKFLQLQVEYNNTYYSGLTGSFNQNINLLNASVAYKFLKNQNAELRLFAFDLLEQNNSITRTTTETYIEDSQTNILRRYFMLSFTYNFKKYSETKKKETE
jgi:hypothetical protein